MVRKIVGIFILLAVISVTLFANEEFDAAKKMLSEGKRDAAIDKLSMIAQTAKDTKIKDEALEACARASCIERKYDNAFNFAKQIPSEFLRKTTEMYVLCDARKYQELVDNYKDESFEKYPPEFKGEAYRLRGTGYYNIKNGTAAEKDLILAVKNLRHANNKGVAMNLLGETYSKLLNNEKKAFEIYDQAMNTHIGAFKKTLALQKLSQICFKQGKYEKILKDLEKINYAVISGRSFPDYAKIYISTKAEALAKTGKIEDAIKTYRKGLTINNLNDKSKKVYQEKIAELMSADKSKILLAFEGKSDYQIIVPEKTEQPAVDKLLIETAELIQKAFAENGFEIPVHYENEIETEKPAIYLGNTKFATKNRINVDKLEGWSYIQKVVGKDIIIAGKDIPNAVTPTFRGNKIFGAQMGTTKGVTDFLKKYAQVRFLYPYGDTGIEFLKTPVISIPSDLDKTMNPGIRFLFSYGDRYGMFGATNLEMHLYLIANNYLPRVNAEGLAHSYPESIPVKKYEKTHPEYFALLGNERIVNLNIEHKWHYCISNPEVQELFYKYLVDNFDKGYDTVYLGQQDGFRSCQCKNCEKLYNTGNDWGEKLWILHRKLAERLRKERPGKTLVIMSYSHTNDPPKTFNSFPDNVVIMLCRTTDEYLAKWSKIKVKKGFIGYLYWWGTYAELGYTAQRTPQFVAESARKFNDFGLKGFFMDGFAHNFGMEGPVYYVFGNTLGNHEDAPETKVILEEFYDAAFRETSNPMRRFFSTLYKSLELYKSIADNRYYDDVYGRPQKLVFRNPMRLLAIMYSPKIIEEMDAQLSQAEKMAVSEKVKLRLKLIRYEFNYMKNIVTVSHLHEAYKISPSLESRESLLTAIDNWNAFMDGIYITGKRWKNSMRRNLLGDWKYPLFSGHSRFGPGLPRQFKNSNCPLEWDTAKVRSAPLPGVEKIYVTKADKEVTLSSEIWSKIKKTLIETPIGSEASGTCETTVKMAYDDTNIYIRFDGKLNGKEKTSGKLNTLKDADKNECFDLAIDPFGNREKFYHFMGGLSSDSKYEGAFGFITDNLHPLFGKEDSSWNGTWKYETSMDNDSAKWIALLTIPFNTLGTNAPQNNTIWRGNFGRSNMVEQNKVSRYLWNGNADTKGVSDTSAFGEIVFGADPAAEGISAVERLKQTRLGLYEKTFKEPEQWKKLNNRLPELKDWIFREDPANQGITDKWFAENLDTNLWYKIEVPSFWAETKAGNYVGYGWYRVTFEIPENFKGKKLKVNIGAADEQAWVYVNGKNIGSHSTESTGLPLEQLWDVPFSYEADSDSLHYGGKNILAIRVHNTVANGGLWRPVVLSIE